MVQFWNITFIVCYICYVGIRHIRFVTHHAFCYCRNCSILINKRRFSRLRITFWATNVLSILWYLHRISRNQSTCVNVLQRSSVTDKKDRGKRIWSSVSRQSGTYLKVEDTFSGLDFVWAWDLFEVCSEVVNYRTPRVTFQWMIDEREAILI